jgi:SIT4-associating protein SAP185/190
MFWRFGGYANISTIDTILDKSDVTLEELLDEADLIQELKGHNSKLIEFLRDENVLRRLLEYVVASKPPDDIDDYLADSIGDVSKECLAQGANDSLKERTRGKARELTEEERDKEEKARNKYSYMAAEVLSSDNWSLAEALMENHQHLRQFWEFIQCRPPLDPLQASYFTKVNESLLDKKTEEMLDFFKSLDNVVPNMLQHVDSPMVMDLLLKIISLEKAEGGAGIIDVSP